MDTLPAIAQGLFFILVAPFVVGLTRWLRAREQLRAGPPLRQVYFDLAKLFRKTSSNPVGASWVFRASPYIVFGCYGVLGFGFPLFLTPLVHPDLISLVYILGLAAFFTALGGMAVGTPFGGLGSSRTMFLRVLVEPALFLIILALSLKVHSTNVMTVVAQMRNFPTAFFEPANLMLLLAAAIVAIIEAHRIPIDNLETNLELTMAQRANLLEYSGPHLALAEWAEGLKLLFCLTFTANLFLPTLIGNSFDLATLLVAFALYVAKVLLLLGCLVVWELLRPRARLRASVEWNTQAIFLALLAIAYTLATQFLAKGTGT